jgi:hypothetical protein
MHQMLSLKIKSTDAFDSFMVSFHNKATYLGLNDHAKRGLLTATLANTDGKNQLLPDRLIKELKHVREQDLNYNDTVSWLKRQDIRQANDGLPKYKSVKKVIDRSSEPKKIKDQSENYNRPDMEALTDGDGMIIKPKVNCHNCCNYGNLAPKCKTMFCCDCIRTKPDHLWSDCTKRIKQFNKKRSYRGNNSFNRPRSDKL